MKGIIYRLGVYLKDAGERHNVGWLKSAGIKVRDFGRKIGTERQSNSIYVRGF